MTLKEDLIKLVAALNRVHAGAFNWSVQDGLPDFVTAESGMQVHFTRDARRALRKISETLLGNRSPDSIKVEIGPYEKVVRQIIADLYAQDDFEESMADEGKKVIEKLKLLSEQLLRSNSDEFTHYIPAWTVGLENDSPFKLGPVTIFNRMDWIDRVEFSPKAMKTFLGESEANHHWKDLVRSALGKQSGEVDLAGLAGPVYSAVSTCPALLEVTVRGYEQDFSKKLAKLVAKTALDCTSLVLGSAEFFFQQAVQEERLPPAGSDSLMSTNGYLWLPGSSIGKRLRHLSGARLRQAKDDVNLLVPEFSSILSALIDPASHSHPKLAMRWATALDWFGEGNRELSDAIAVAKLGSCLDVLGCGGKFAGIRDMVINLTDTSGDTIVVKGDRPLTLAELIKNIYDDGRSKILHGTHFDRLKSFEVERRQASEVARVVLIAAAQRLMHYSGSDVDKAFRTMQSSSA
ncbi:hypothetical protein [Herbaspirillum sp. CAH-3]|uniref:hypothetical protein n=1 Tax=Herbaspirillum sp. CAH-3 TaxID=2605746 RepID=UPI0012ACA88D|nr:hypothetical protein [Herbaspirillum sp. CAH-3]MRT28661.1 hypothetical protein [Herbaspirillum sp. CAH-3]